MHDRTGLLARLTGRYAVLVVGLWVLAAAAANLAVPQLERVVDSHARSFMPPEAPSAVAAARAAQLFNQTPSNNFVYVVLERDQRLAPGDRQFYDALTTKLGSDHRHVYAVTDLWSQPATAAGAQSSDGRAVSVMVRLAGMLGTSQARDSVNSVRAAIQTLSPPAGLEVHVTGPGATIVDEFSAIDRQMLGITAATIGLILLLLLMVYRSPVAAAIPLISVGLALALARAIVAALGRANVVEVSLFSVALMAAMTLGAGTDYAIFLVGRYHEGRRHGIPPERALTQAYRSVAPVVIGSALTVSVALACLVFAHVGAFRSAGLPCAIGILATMVAALTLTPALMGLAVRRGYLEPRPSRTARRWRRVGTAVARWPGPILVAALGLTLLAALPLAGMRVGFNEPAATPSSTDSNRGYASADRHFSANALLPDVIAIQADHDLRNPAGLIAIERVTRHIMAVPGVRAVQSASRPDGKVPEQATLSYQAGVLGRQFGDTMDSLTRRLQRVSELDGALAQTQAAVDGLGNGLRGGSAGLADMSGAAEDMRAGMDGLQRNVTTVSGYLDPLRDIVGRTPDCAANPICSTVDRVLQPVDSLVQTSARLDAGATKLTSGSSTAATAMAGLPQSVSAMKGALGQARSATHDLLGLTDTLGPQMRQLTDYMNEIATQFQGSAAADFYMPQRALTDPRYTAVLGHLISENGRAAYLLVYGDGSEWGADGANRADQVRAAIKEATKEGTLTPLEVDLAGVGPVTADLQRFVASDTTLLVGAALVLIFLIVTAMLRSPVAGLVVVGTVVLSYASAVGASVLIWQHLLHQDLHWSVAPIAFIALIAVGADYNLLLALRIKQEAAAGLRTGIIRAFGGTGGVVTVAGIVFGLTMLALLSSSVLSIAQIGTTIAVGLLLDTLVVRAFVVPSIVALLGRWFWWPSRPPRRAMAEAVKTPEPQLLTAAGV
ncbi:MULTISPECIES: MMPL/RND family transporter [Mycobacterium avium complex (MAC)]|uniref:Putative membrane protein, MmpL family n=1 Tax=Mycobacterium intracellulare TaxID=1767 RepID=A0A7R7MYW4_MYCIT|nr:MULTISPECIES: RND family transporter [Mycobacterium avium complex (MAC)]ASW97951.1 MMPL family RND transporter [Mycobacterium intracellulare]MCA2233631.1 RND family transporter [Mycobacterium intracellulare]MCA2246519.1 RND family transporter [Mycobacterium intracellulare]MCA2358401.1 RND family transporter [Mycobacterium intracellulare]MCA2368949.1 RND family transporter [Mycobacterium intracellulare]